MKIEIPFGKEHLPLELPDEKVAGVLASKLNELESAGESAVKKALSSPAGSKKLSELALGKKKITIITSDHTRPVPSHITMPLLLEEIRATAPNAEITILIATGCHRAMTEEELLARFGSKIFENEKIIVHDSMDDSSMVEIGTLPSGGKLILNRLAIETDLLVTEGFIEPHFFAGFSGGRKSVLPGISNYQSVLANHSAEFIAHPSTRAGVLDGNPIHLDMLYAAQTAKVAFILNVVINAQKEIVAAFAGDLEKAHLAGCEFVAKYSAVAPIFSDIVVTSNGGYPLDQNIYQSVKSMTAAEASCNEGGVIIIASECADGHGGESFLRMFDDIKNERELMNKILERGRDATAPDQWEIQIFLRVLLHATVIMVTKAPLEMLERLHIKNAGSLEEAIKMAVAQKPNSKITIIPDGVGVIVK